MLPLCALLPEEAARVRGVVSDVDDTILDHGALTEAALAALFRADRAGLPVVLATGRSIAFAEVLARLWPVAGVVAENGALACIRRDRRVVRLDPLTADQRGQRRARLDLIVTEVRAAFPTALLSDDASGRVSDVTFDIGEACFVPAEQVRAMAAHAEKLGARTTTSSVHLHLTLDGHDKASGVLEFLHRQCGVDPTLARSRWAYLGDSTNDAPAFAAFRTTFGVANVRAALPSLVVPPRYLAAAERGAGFAEILDALLRHARGPSSSP